MLTIPGCVCMALATLPHLNIRNKPMKYVFNMTLIIPARSQQFVSYIWVQLFYYSVYGYMCNPSYLNRPLLAGLEPRLKTAISGVSC